MTVKKEFPKPLKVLYDDLYTEVSLLHARWELYRTLYGTSEKRLALLRASADQCFALLHHILLEDLQICLGRLSDPAISGSDKNLSLALLIDSARHNGDADLADRLSAIHTRFIDKCRVMRKRRNKLVAHRDLKTVSRGSNGLPGFSRQDVENVIKEIRVFMNEIEQHYLGSTVLFEKVLLPTGPEALVLRLKAAQRYQELRECGAVTPDDIQKSKFKDA